MDEAQSKCKALSHRGFRLAGFEKEFNQRDGGKPGTRSGAAGTRAFIDFLPSKPFG